MPEAERHFSVVTGDSDIHVRVAGAGSPLLLLHGAEGDHTMFTRLIDSLRSTFSCIVFDQRGCGRTSTRSSRYTADDIADDAVMVMDKAGFGAAHVYGTSFGGQVAQSLAARHPARVKGLILGSTWCTGSTLSDINETASHALRQLRMDREANAHEIARYFYPDAYLQAHPEAIARFRIPPATGEKYRSRSECVATRIAAVAAQITAPTLVIAGSQDRLVGVDTTLELASVIPGARNRVLEGAGHLPSLQMPDILAAEIHAFLAGNMHTH